MVDPEIVINRVQNAVNKRQGPPAGTPNFRTSIIQTEWVLVWEVPRLRLQYVDTAVALTLA